MALNNTAQPAAQPAPALRGVDYSFVEGDSVPEDLPKWENLNYPTSASLRIAAERGYLYFVRSSRFTLNGGGTISWSISKVTEVTAGGYLKDRFSRNGNSFNGLGRCDDAVAGLYIITAERAEAWLASRSGTWKEDNATVPTPPAPAAKKLPQEIPEHRHFCATPKDIPLIDKMAAALGRTPVPTAAPTFYNKVPYRIFTSQNALKVADPTDRLQNANWGA